MTIELTALHWIYVVFIVLIIGFMVKRRDTTLVCILGIFLLAITATKNLTASISGVFNSFAFAISELLSTILIICIIVAMSQVLKKTGINEVMVAPFTKIIKTPTLGFWTIGILMMVISWFFWPSPAVALLGAVLLPVVIRARLPALGVPNANKGTFYSSIFLYILLIIVKTKNIDFTAFLVFILARNYVYGIIVIGKPLTLSPAFPSPHTVRATFIAYGVPTNSIHSIFM